MFPHLNQTFVPSDTVFEVFSPPQDKTIFITSLKGISSADAINCANVSLVHVMVTFGDA